MDDAEYRALQNILVARPDTGKLIAGSGGLRKLRWFGLGKGKRGLRNLLLAQKQGNYSYAAYLSEKRTG